MTEVKKDRIWTDLDPEIYLPLFASSFLKAQKGGHLLTYSPGCGEACPGGYRFQAFLMKT